MLYYSVAQDEIKETRFKVQRLAHVSYSEAVGDCRVQLFPEADVFLHRVDPIDVIPPSVQKVNVPGARPASRVQPTFA